jgi:uncharacterized protein YfaS (alpha-2-macroglobulin family)
MDGLRRGFDVLYGALRFLVLGIASLLSGLVGRWEPPDWLQWLLDLLMNAVARLREWAVARPGVAAVVGLLFVGLVAGGVAGWRWYERQPKPTLVTFTVEAPPRTCYECEPPGKPNPLIVRFSESVAPLEQSGKALDGKKLPLTMSPNVPGQWRWLDDKTLQFQPAEDWPVGEPIEVSFAKRGFIAAHLRLEKYGFESTTPVFQARIAETQFYQDPVVATDKKALLTLAFTHPVDPAELESRIRVRLFDKIAEGQEKESGPVAFRVTYDQLKLQAYIQSEQLSVPAKEGRLEFLIDKNLRAARGGNRTEEPLKAEIKVPGLNSLALQDLKLDLARDEQQEPQQVAVLEFSASVLEKETPPRFKAWLLPARHPDAETQKRFEEGNPGQPYDWNGCGCLGGAFDNRILEAAQSLPLTQLPGEREHSALQSFRYTADPNRFLYLRLDKGLKSFGGYVLGETQERILRVPEFPKELRIAAQGSWLALSGAKTLNVLSRDVPAMRVEVSRLLPKQLQHLMTQTRGNLSSPEFQNWAISADNLSERYSKVERFPKLKPGAAHYTALDLAPYLKSEGGERRGVFLLKLEAWDADNNRAVYAPKTNEWGNSYDAPVSETRLIVITDLGLLVKRNLDGAQDLFVQSIHDGEPVAGVTVDVIGRNGLSVLSATTDGDGHVRFPSLKDFERERYPVLYLVRKDGDSAFLPIDYRARELDLSRFDVGGVQNNADRRALSAYLFSDRGIYRPGEEIRVGAIVRTQDWSALPKGLPLLLEVTDARGQTVRKEKLALSEAGFEDIRQETQAASATGTWTVSLSIVRDEYRNDLIGSVEVSVREFQPDRMKMSATLSSASTAGWVSPDALKARVHLENLFGAPAQERRITATLRLQPSLPEFAAYPDYRFSDPQAAKEGFSEELGETKTDERGDAEIDLRLNRFAKATYRLQLVAQGFEADGGRAVAAQASQLVSSMPFLIGVKPDGDLSYVSRNGKRAASLIAIDPQAKKTKAEGLKLARVEVKYVSVLVKQNNGTYKYESRKKEISLDESEFSIPADGVQLPLDAATPGNFAYLVRDAQGQVLARVDYTVAGEGNLAARLEKNAELQLTLSKKDYQPGEEIELQINAPYAGAGLITVERDKVYAWRWFRTTTTASTQRIRLPADLEGNAYVSVSFVRDPSSDEIYTSPLSYGVAAFSIDRTARRAEVTLAAPQKVKPGETAQFRYRTDRPAKLVLFAVDEGILQVARYQTPDPVGFLMQKRSLDVTTMQILDLILPEFRAALMQAAPGGDMEGLLAKHLNPFRRKNDPPIAYWSGIVEADSTERTLSYVVPDSFDGRLRVIAVAVSDAAIGVAESATLVRGDFVLSPNAPMFVAPGDEFEVSLGVSNQAEGSGPNARLALTLESGAGLEVVGTHKQDLAVAEGREGSVKFRLRATEQLGDAELKFLAAAGDKAAKRRISLSVRPAVPYVISTTAGAVKPGANVEAKIPRQLYPQFRELEAGFSALPLGLAHGFVSYLAHYPYSCTEQLVSQAMPAIVLSRRPEFGRVDDPSKKGLGGLIAELRARQNPDGAYRYWPGAAGTEEFVSVYVQHVLLEAAERGQAVPRDLIDRGNDYLRTVASRDGDTLDQERNGAYAIYLLTRQGQVLSADVSRLRERLQSRYKDQWRGDIAAAYLAATMALMKQSRDAQDLIARVDPAAERKTDGWHDPMTSDAELIYLLARHFPQRLEKLPPSVIERLVARITDGRYHSLSAATTLLALDAYANAAAPAVSGKLSVSELSGKQSRALTLPENLMPKLTFGADATALRFANGAELPAYWLIAQSGFDRKLPAEPSSKGFEILREYTDREGRPVTAVKQGDEIDVHLKFRALDERSTPNVALVDLLPGGFELVVPPREAQQAFAQASAEEGEPSEAVEGMDGEEGGDGEMTEGEDTPVWNCPVCLPATKGVLHYADFRDDRIVFYALVQPQIGEIVYRIKATNAGSYAVPPAYGEGLYRRELSARSAAGKIVVNAP